MYFIVYVIHKHNQYLTGIQLPLGTNIGPGLMFGHFSDIVINPSVTIGKCCTIYNGVTIGSKRGPNGGVPSIGNNVCIFSGSKIVGNLQIDDNVVIGVNAVVVKDIPRNAVVGGIPAKVISYNASEILERYINLYDLSFIRF